MEQLTSRLRDYTKKFRYPLLILAIGILFMLFPAGSREEPTVTEPDVNKPSLQEQLEEILCQVRGAGRVRVLLTESEGERIIYQTDDSGADNTLRRDTVTLTDAQRNQTGLIRQIESPIYQGALVICQGADSAAVRLAIVEAVADLTGLSTDKITVLKMK